MVKTLCQTLTAEFEGFNSLHHRRSTTVRCHEVSSVTQPIRIKTSDGYCLSGMLFMPPSTAPTRLIVISAATGVPQQFYAAYAQHLSTLGCAVVTYDYRGVGQSRPSSLRGFQTSLRDWVNDIGDVIRC